MLRDTLQLSFLATASAAIQFAAEKQDERWNLFAATPLLSAVVICSRGVFYSHILYRLDCYSVLSSRTSTSASLYLQQSNSNLSRWCYGSSFHWRNWLWCWLYGTVWTPIRRQSVYEWTCLKKRLLYQVKFCFSCLYFKGIGHSNFPKGGEHPRRIWARARRSPPIVPPLLIYEDQGRVRKGENVTREWHIFMTCFRKWKMSLQTVLAGEAGQ